MKDKKIPEQMAEKEIKRKIVTCPLCGMSFDANTEKACGGCGKAKNCPMVVCPNCYHEFLPDKK